MRALQAHSSEGGSEEKRGQDKHSVDRNPQTSGTGKRTAYSLTQPQTGNNEGTNRPGSQLLYYTSNSAIDARTYCYTQEAPRLPGSPQRTGKCRKRKGIYRHLDTITSSPHRTSSSCSPKKSAITSIKRLALQDSNKNHYQQTILPSRHTALPTSPVHPQHTCLLAHRHICCAMADEYISLEDFFDSPDEMWGPTS